MESFLLVCVAFMFSFYSQDKINLWYSAINFCVVSESIILFFCVKIQISVFPLSTENIFLRKKFDFRRQI